VQQDCVPGAAKKSQSVQPVAVAPSATDNTGETSGEVARMSKVRFFSQTGWLCLGPSIPSYTLPLQFS